MGEDKNYLDLMREMYYEVTRATLLFAKMEFEKGKDGDEVVRALPKFVVKEAATSMGGLLSIVFKYVWEWVDVLAMIENERKRALFERIFFHEKVAEGVSEDAFIIGPNGLYSSKS